MEQEILRMVDAIHREKNIDKDILFDALESALESVAQKKFPFTGEIEVDVNREEGSLKIVVDGDEIDPGELGRIAAQNVYQIIIQKIKDAENDVIFMKYKKKEKALITGSVRRIDKGNMWINIGDVDGFLPSSEQVRGERYQLGERIRCVIKEVKKANSNVSVILSRSSEYLVLRLFEIEIPEIANRVITIKGIVRRPGKRSKVAVHSSDMNIDCIGACVGVNGSRIWSIINEVNEKIDIVRWNENPQIYIANSLSPAEIMSVELCPKISYARVIVDKSQVPLAIGKGGMNIKLSAELTGWDLDIFNLTEVKELKQQGEKDLKELPGLGDKTFNKLRRENIRTLDDLVVFGSENLIEVSGISESAAEEIIDCAEKKIDERIKARREEEKQAKEKNEEKETEKPITEEEENEDNHS